MKPVLALLCLFTVISVQAQDIYQNDITSMLFVKYTFAGDKSADRDNGLKLGFTVNHSYTALDRMGRINPYGDYSFQRKLLDVEVSSQTRFFSKLRVGGVDALTYRTVLNADGEAERWPMGLSKEQLLGIGILAGAVGYWVYNEFEDDE